MANERIEQNATEAATGHLKRVLRALPEDSTDYGVLAARESAHSLFSALVALAGRVDELEKEAQWLRDRDIEHLRRAAELERELEEYKLAAGAEAHYADSERNRRVAAEEALVAARRVQRNLRERQKATGKGETVVPQLRANITRALNLSPLVPPNAGNETLEIVEGAWLALHDFCVLGEKAERAVYLAKHLFEMVDRETWRAQGAEWMGQYEGDYWAEQILQEIQELGQGQVTHGDRME
jgi:hypothetical protein